MDENTEGARNQAVSAVRYQFRKSVLSTTAYHVRCPLLYEHGYRVAWVHWNYTVQWHAQPSE